MKHRLTHWLVGQPYAREGAASVRTVTPGRRARLLVDDQVAGGDPAGFDPAVDLAIGVRERLECEAVGEGEEEGDDSPRRRCAD